MNTLTVTAVDENEYKIVMSSMTEGTIKPVDGVVKINGIVYSVHAWVRWGSDRDRWLIGDVYMRRSNNAFDGPTDIASSKMYHVIREIVKDHIAGNDELIDGGRKHGLQADINRLESEVEERMLEIVEKRAAIESAYESLAS